MLNKIVVEKKKKKRLPVSFFIFFFIDQFLTLYMNILQGTMNSLVYVCHSSIEYK